MNGSASVDPLVRRIRMQAQACVEMVSPLYGFLLEHVADDVLANGPSAAVLAGHEADSGPSALALRLMGAVHRLAHLALEPRRRTPSADHEYLVVLRHWPDGEERVLGSAVPTASQRLGLTCRSQHDRWHAGRRERGSAP